jgi:uncharacterized repeat protein (TIGR01451 family)
MKRLLLPISVFIAVIAAVILIQPSQALDAPPVESVQAQTSLHAYAPDALPVPPWYNQAWSVRRPVTITNSGSALTNIQVLVNLGSSFDYTHAQTDGADLRVTAGDGTTLIPFWIESWSSTAQRAWVWVNVPSLPNGNTVIYLYYGNPSATSASDGTATFEAYDGYETYAVNTAPWGNYTDNPGEWDRYANNPVLQRGATGSWDSDGATFASVISDTTTGEYRMYYHGWGTGCTGTCIGLATSTNGLTWTKYASNPVMRATASTWDSGGVRVPMVWMEDTGGHLYHMIYTGNGSGGMQVGYAYSDDGISWIKNASNPVFNDPTWAHNSTENWGVIKVGSEYLMWYSNFGMRQSGIAHTTILTAPWTAYTTAPIFTSSGVTSDYRYSQYCPFTFVYGGYYYVLVPSYSSVGDYARYYLYRSSSPYFTTRELVRVAHTVGDTGQWDEQDSDTPFVLTSGITRSLSSTDPLLTYYAGTTAGGIWAEGLLVENDIATALAAADLPYGVGWANTNSISVTVVSNPVRQGLRSLRLNDTGSGSVSSRGTFAQKTQGEVGVWVRRTSSGTGGTDLYLYGNGPGGPGDGLAAVVGLGGTNRQFHYWSRGTFTNVATQWSADTWYYVSIIFNIGTSTYDFVVYDTNLTEVVRVNGINLWRTSTPGTYVNSATFYTDGATYVGQAFWDDFRLRKNPLPALTVNVGTAAPIVDLAIGKTANAGTIYLGDRLTYTLRITNTSLYVAPAVIVTDSLPAQVSLVSAVPSQGTCTPGSPLTCGLGAVAGGGSASIRIVVTAVTSGAATNRAGVSTSAVEFALANNTATLATTILSAADLSVTKVDNSDPVWAGNPLSYTITVHNGGPLMAASVSLQDTLPSGLTFVSMVPGQGSCTSVPPFTCSLGNMASGQNVNVILRVNTTINGSFTNQVSVASVTHDQAPGNNSDSETTTVLPSADLSVSKVGGPNPVYAGNPYTYTITVHNDGPSSAAGVILTDTLPAGVVFMSASGNCTGTGPVVCTWPSLPASSNTQVRVVVRTTLEGQITNRVKVTSTTHDRNLVNNTSEYVTNVTPQANLSVDKVDLPDPVYAGYPLTYTITVHNSGPSTAATVQLVDTLPTGVTIDSVTFSQGNCTSGSVVTCGLGSLSAGNNAVVRIVVLTTVDGVINNVVNVASVTYDRDLTDNQDTTATTVAPAADLVVSQVDDPDPVRASHPLTYTITVHNNGPSSAANVTLTDVLPTGVGFVSASPACSGTGPVVCTWASLPASGNTQVQVVVMTTLEGLLTNTVTVASPTYDRNLANNTDEEVTVVATIADISITQEDTPDPVIAEQELTYIITVHNAGPSIAGSVLLTDTLPADVTLVSATPDQGSCSGASVVTCDLDYLLNGDSAIVEVVVIPQVPGSIVNTVEVSTGTFEDNLANNTDTESTTVSPLSADLRLTLTDTPDPVLAGALLTYTAQVANLGPSRAIGTSVSFDLSSEVTFMTSTPPCSDLGGTVTCLLGEIAANDSAVVTLTARVSSSTFATQITSEVDASSSVADPIPTNNHASVTTVVVRSADLAIDIFDTPDPVIPGNTLTYTLAYTNSGPSDAINLLLTDYLPANVEYVRTVPAVCDHTAGTPIVTCLPSNLQAGHSAQILLVVSVKPAADQPLVNEVDIVAETPDPNDDNNLNIKETTVVDGEPPSITWVAPVGDEEKYYVMIRPGLEITLTAIVTDNVQVDRVRFARWDHVALVWVPLGVFSENPSHVYQVVMIFDNCLDLPPGDNGIYVFAYDTAGNWNWKRIWIVPYPYPVVLPLIMK